MQMFKFISINKSLEAANPCLTASDHYLMLLLREIGIVDDDDMPTDEIWNKVIK